MYLFSCFFHVSFRIQKELEELNKHQFKAKAYNPNGSTSNMNNDSGSDLNKTWAAMEQEAKEKRRQVFKKNVDISIVLSFEKKTYHICLCMCI